METELNFETTSMMRANPQKALMRVSGTAGITTALYLGKVNSKSIFQRYRLFHRLFVAFPYFYLHLYRPTYRHHGDTRRARLRLLNDRGAGETCAYSNG